MKSWPDRDDAGNSICDRCRLPMRLWSMSYFNEDLICDDCDKKERAHPLFAEAQATEEAAVRAGNYNFPGVGLPPGL
jgi:hypothetical protein